MRGSMESYPGAAVERAMKLQEVILRPLACFRILTVARIPTTGVSYAANEETIRRIGEGMACIDEVQSRRCSRLAPHRGRESTATP